MRHVLSAMHASDVLHRHWLDSSLISRRSTLPAALTGSWSRNSTTRGTL